MSYYIHFTGIGILIFSLSGFFIFNERIVNYKSGAYVFTVGATWVIGALLVAFAIMNYNTSISIILALNCTVCFFTILLSLIVSPEWKETYVVRLIIGSILIVVGAMLVSTSLIGDPEKQSTVVEHIDETLP